MSDDTTNTGTDQPEAGQPQVTQRILGQFVRDMSFENVMAQKGVSGEVQPEIQVQVNLDAKKRSQENTYEVITKLTITSKTKDKGETLFLLELEYSRHLPDRGRAGAAASSLSPDRVPASDLPPSSAASSATSRATAVSRR